MRKDDNYVYIFDTTLRDGEQSPGCSMNLEEKLRVAEVLEQMGVDIIEAGFPMASEGDFEAVRAIAGHVKDSVICGLARAKDADIDRCAEAIKPARRGRIHTFISTSPIHLKYQLKMSEEDVYNEVIRTVTRARKYTDDVEWSCMDATRSRFDFVARCVEAAINAGATTINVPDTVGYTTPFEIYRFFDSLKNKVPNIDKAILSAHCHNDLGMATANALAAVAGGARQIECTINGIGERAGNTALEEVVMAIKTRKDEMPYTTGINAEMIMQASHLVSGITGFNVQPNKAIVGANAFAHESGIHQDGVLKEASTYEIMTPESVGLRRSNLVMGKHSGRHAFKNKLIELGYDLGDNALEDAFVRFKTLADKKKNVYDDDIHALLSQQAGATEDHYRLEWMNINWSGEERSVMLSMRTGGELRTVTTSGDGPVDAIFTAIRDITGSAANLNMFQVNAVTGEKDAQANVLVRLEQDGQLINGHSSDTDTLTAAAMAYINALNKQRSAPQKLNINKTGGV